jgi:nitrite reductase/ring-hydroxylating ferredoxin subunit
MATQESIETSHSSDCNDCVLGSRRDFLRRSAMIVGVLAAASGAAPESVRALVVRFGTGRRHGASDVSYPVPTADGTTIDTKNQVILVRYQSVVYAFNLSCPHQNTALRWNQDDQQFQCPKHKSHYKPDGTFISGRATRGMDRLAIRGDGANVVVDVDQMFKEDENKASWDAAVVKVG